MQSNKEELQSWRRVSHLLDQLHGPKKGDKAPLKETPAVCPFCGKAKVRVEFMQSMNEFDDVVKIGFFTCTSCGQDWSNKVDK
jgi:DNA-directed RNA polymerase subunit M/transcription elongation factor TFIIS